MLVYQRLDAENEWDSEEEKPEILLDLSLSKALYGISPSFCGRQAAGSSSLSVSWHAATTTSFPHKI